MDVIFCQNATYDMHPHLVAGLDDDFRMRLRIAPCKTLFRYFVTHTTWNLW